MICAWGMLLFLLLLHLAGGSCPMGCLCTSDILTCTSQGLEKLPLRMFITTRTLDFSYNRLTRLDEGSISGLPRLGVLRLAHNQLSQILPGAFCNASTGLWHLDLSSNKLRVIEQHYFQNLGNLEELLLFDNLIIRVESKALANLGYLRKVYLSHNHLIDFPFFSINEHGHPFLHLLDLSSNRLLRLSLEDIVALPLLVKKGLFLHNNTLICLCEVYRIFRSWDLQGFDSVRDYREQHICLLQHSRYFENCTLGIQSLRTELVGSVQINAGNPILLNCQTSLKGPHLSYLWLSPNQEYIFPPGNNHSVGLFPNGSLWIPAAKAEDSGVYLCVALDRNLQRNETREVNVTVLSQQGQIEHFNTGFTTLLGCLVSLLLVLMYLYLTPCRCWCRMQRPPPVSPILTRQPALHNISPSGLDVPTRKSGCGKHVVFLEPVKDVRNGKL